MGQTPSQVERQTPQQRRRIGDRPRLKLDGRKDTVDFLVDPGTVRRG